MGAAFCRLEGEGAGAGQSTETREDRGGQEVLRAAADRLSQLQGEQRCSQELLQPTALPRLLGSRAKSGVSPSSRPVRVSQPHVKGEPSVLQPFL